MSSRNRRYNRRRRYGRAEPVLLLQDDGRDLAAAILAGIGRLLSRYRSELAPVYIAVAVFVAGVWLHHMHSSGADWPDLAEQAGLPGSKVLSIVVGKFGYVLRLALKKGHTAAQAIAAIAGIESALGLRVGSVRVEPEPKRADRVVVRVIEKDPHEQPIPLPARPQIGGASVNKRLPLGLFEDGQPVGVLVKGRHVSIGCTTGAGKSGLLYVFLADLTECRDVAVWGVDLKGGMELGPWRGCLATLATTPGAAVDVLQAG